MRLFDSGRTELGLAMFGLKRTDSGKIKMHGKDVTLSSPRDAIGAGIGYVPEDRLSEGLFLPRSIGDNIVVSELDKLKGGMGTYDIAKADEEKQLWVKELGVKTLDHKNAASTLSGGNQQKVVLAKWMAVHPDVLILNGPTVGVDIGSKHDIHAILQKQAKDGMAVIIISDDLPEILQNCSRILVIKEGRFVAEMSAGETSEDAILEKMM